MPDAPPRVCAYLPLQPARKITLRLMVMLRMLRFLAGNAQHALGIKTQGARKAHATGKVPNQSEGVARGAPNGLTEVPWTRWKHGVSGQRHRVVVVVVVAARGPPSFPGGKR